MPIVLGLIVVGAVVAFLATRSPGPRLSPEKEEVSALTRDLFGLVAEKEYKEIVRRFYEPDTKRFERTGEALREIVRGRGVPGLNIFRATCMDNLKEAEEFVKRYDTKYPRYVVGVLAAITFQDGALRTTIGGTFAGMQRTEEFLAWYLSLVFREANVRRAEIADIRWDQWTEEEALLVVTVEYPKPVEPIPGVADPSLIPWRRLPSGHWVLALGDDTHLDEVLQFLQRVKL